MVLCHLLDEGVRREVRSDATQGGPSGEVDIFALAVGAKGMLGQIRAHLDLVYRGDDDVGTGLSEKLCRRSKEGKRKEGKAR